MAEGQNDAGGLEAAPDKSSPKSPDKLANEKPVEELPAERPDGEHLPDEVTKGSEEEPVNQDTTEPSKLEAPKAGHEDDEGSQSIKLELEETEENVEPREEDKEQSAEDKKIEEEEDKQLGDGKETEPEVKSVDVAADEGEEPAREIPPETAETDEKKSENKEQSDRTDVAKENSEQLTTNDAAASVKDEPRTSETKDEGKKEEPGHDKPGEAEKPRIVEDKKTETSDAPTTAGEREEEETEARRRKGEEEAGIESEVGIVEQPRVAGELLNEEELVAERPALPTVEHKPPAISDRVARWLENSAVSEAKEPGPTTRRTIEETRSNDVEENGGACKPRTRAKRRLSTGTISANATAAAAAAAAGEPTGSRKSQRVVSNIIRRSIRCLNKMHAMESGGGSSNGKKSSADSAEEIKREEEDEESRKSPKVPQAQQNGAALPEEAASADRTLPHPHHHHRQPVATASVNAAGSPPKREKKEAEADHENQQSESLLSRLNRLQQSERALPSPRRLGRPSAQRNAAAKQQQQQDDHQPHQPTLRETRKRRSAEASSPADDAYAANGSAAAGSSPKKLCLDQREQYINSLIGSSDKYTPEQLAARAEQLRSEVQDLDELARAKEMEWNEILSMRKLKEEAYLRLERRRQVLGFMETNGPLLPEQLAPANLALVQQSYEPSGKDSKLMIVPKEEQTDNAAQDPAPAAFPRRDRASRAQISYQQQQSCKQQAENGPRQVMAQVDAQSPEHRQIGEGRQGPIVDVRSIIADYRLRHPETVPRRRGRRMKNSVNIGLGAGGAMMETMGNMDSRPSSTDSCKSNSNVTDPTAMSYKDVLVQFAKLSQQQGEPIKTPHNYPDVTLHPVTTAPTTPNSAAQVSGSLLHGILTKSQSPRPTTFSPTLARLLTAPERERAAPTIAPVLHQASTQHLLQAYQNAGSVSISDFLSSSKARTEITITPVVNNPIQSHSNNLIHVDDGEEETSIIEERDSRLSMSSRDNREDRDTPPRCQGCHDRAAQFVCAGCGNQWYCSRECQVAAWDEHSEVCSG